jgi:hypothetical protein
MLLPNTLFYAPSTLNTLTYVNGGCREYDRNNLGRELLRIARWRHLMIEHLKEFSDNAVAFVCRGHVTKGDDDTVLVPAVMQALKNHEKLRLYYETAADFFGIDPGAVWEDIKVGMEYFTRWERMAVVTDVEWIK